MKYVSKHIPHGHSISSFRVKADQGDTWSVSPVKTKDRAKLFIVSKNDIYYTTVDTLLEARQLISVVSKGVSNEVC